MRQAEPDASQIGGILGAVAVDEDMDTVGLALSAPGGEWRVMIGDDAGPAVPRAEVEHAIECGLVWLTQAPSGAPVWRLTDKGQACLGAVGEPDEAADEATVDTGAEDAPPVAPAAVSSRPALADPFAFLARVAAAPASASVAPLPTPRKSLPPPAAHEVIEVSAASADDDDPYGYGY